VLRILSDFHPPQPCPSSLILSGADFRNIICSVWKSSLETGKRPGLDRTRTDRTGNSQDCKRPQPQSGLWSLPFRKFQDRTKTGLHQWQPLEVNGVSFQLILQIIMIIIIIIKFQLIPQLVNHSPQPTITPLQLPIRTRTTTAAANVDDNDVDNDDNSCSCQRGRQRRGRQHQQLQLQLPMRMTTTTLTSAAVVANVGDNGSQCRRRG
jgi:hypothetical protein